MDLKPWWVYTQFGFLAGIIVFLIFVLAGRNASARKPGRFQSAIELLFDLLRGQFAGALGPGGVKYLPLAMALFFYVLVSNLMGLIPGMLSPTAATSTTIALGVVVFIIVQSIGIRHNGIVGYLKHFIGPVLLLAPLFIIIELVGEIAKPFSLGMRLFGNVYGEDIINGLLTDAGAKTHFFIPFQAPVYALQIFTDLIQAYIFAILTCSYIAMFTSAHHQDEIDIPNEYETGAELAGTRAVSH